MEAVCSKQLLVLVVENHDEVRELIGNLVAAQGWRPIKAANVRDALACLRTNAIDAVISDWELGDGDGRSVVSEASKCTTRRIPSIMVSSYASTELRDEAVKAGALDLLEKPFRMEQLAEILCRELNTGTPVLS